MNVKELRDMLADLPDDMDVFMQRDAAGNGYLKLRCADPDGVLDPDGFFGATIHGGKYTAEDACKGESEWAELLAKPRVLVLSP